MSNKKGRISIMVLFFSFFQMAAYNFWVIRKLNLFKRFTFTEKYFTVMLRLLINPLFRWQKEKQKENWFCFVQLQSKNFIIHHVPWRLGTNENRKGICTMRACDSLLRDFSLTPHLQNYIEVIERKVRLHYCARNAQRCTN